MSRPPHTFARYLLGIAVCLHTSACELVLGDIPAEALLLDGGLDVDAAVIGPVLPAPNLDPSDAMEDDDGSTKDDSSNDGEETTPPGPDDPSTPGDGDTPEKPEPPDETPTTNEPGETSEPCAVETDFWLDADGDGFGTGTPVQACTKPSGLWAKRGGDCADDNPLVHPNQRDFFDEPYLRADGSESYDYNCSGSEEGDGTLQLAGNCEAIVTAKCGGSGYAKNTPVRAGGNAYCGSTTLETCKTTLAVFLCKAVASTTDVAYRCR